MDDKEFDQALAALQRLLPETMRAEWLIVPRHTMYQAAIGCLLLGGAIALVVAGIVLDVGSLTWGYPLVLAAMALVTRFVPWWRRGDRMLERWWYEARRDGGA